MFVFLFVVGYRVWMVQIGGQDVCFELGMLESFKDAMKWVTEGAGGILMEVGVDFGNKWELVYSILHLFRGWNKECVFLMARMFGVLTCSGFGKNGTTVSEYKTNGGCLLVLVERMQARNVGEFRINKNMCCIHMASEKFILGSKNFD